MCPLIACPLPTLNATCTEQNCTGIPPTRVCDEDTIVSAVCTPNPTGDCEWLMPSCPPDTKTVSCTTDADCPTGTACACANPSCHFNGTCTNDTASILCPDIECAPLTFESCMIDADCPAGTVCSCANPSCNINGTCRNPAIKILCQNIGCFLIASANTGCMKNADCPTGTVCSCANPSCNMNGTCRNPNVRIMCPLIACAQAGKVGTCPVSTTVSCSGAASTCSSDMECPDDKKCCDNDCGFNCQTPLGTSNFAQAENSQTYGASSTTCITLGNCAITLILVALVM